ncbi:MAG: carboxyl transferase [Oscillospiraceae bacterium]|jgi:acetyl-CoA carboxylase carboxyltransferase component|nr:carboxyl transferase [Oscillospiraceae bacterium]
MVREETIARRRVRALLDPNSFVELDALVSGGEGVVTGYGAADGRPVYIFAQDPSEKSGAVSAAHAAKILKALRLARSCGAPVVGMFDSAGAWLEDGVLAMNAYAELFAQAARMSGVVPMVGVALGACVGAGAILPALMDAVIASESASQWIVGPGATAKELGLYPGQVRDKELGGAQAHAKRGGVAILARDEAEAIGKARALLALLPDNSLESVEDEPTSDADINRALTAVDPAKPEAIVSSLLDSGTALPLYALYAGSVTVTLGRVGGRAVGIITATGKICSGGCRKAARFIRLCDCFNIPIISLVNTDGIAAAAPRDLTDTIKAVAQLSYAIAEATTAKLTIITRDAVGAGYAAFGGRASADAVYAWPGAVISPITPEAAVAALNKDELGAAKGGVEATRQRLIDGYARDVADGANAARLGLIDDIIEPADTRRLLISALEMLQGKRDQNPPKKHGNLPL